MHAVDSQRLGAKVRGISEASQAGSDCSSWGQAWNCTISVPVISGLSVFFHLLDIGGLAPTPSQLEHDLNFIMAFIRKQGHQTFHHGRCKQAPHVLKEILTVACGRQKLIPALLFYIIGMPAWHWSWIPASPELEKKKTTCLLNFPKKLELQLSVYFGS